MYCYRKSVICDHLRLFPEKHLSLVENLKEMKKMLVGIGAESGPDMQYGGLEFFDVNQAKEITNYLYTR